MSFISFKSSFTPTSTLLTRAVKAFDGARVVRSDVQPTAQAVLNFDALVAQSPVFIIASLSEEADLMSWSTSNLSSTLESSSSSFDAAECLEEEEGCSTPKLTPFLFIFSWSVIQEATLPNQPNCITPEIIVSSPSTYSSLAEEHRTDLFYYKLTPYGFLREMVGVITGIDFDNDYSELPRVFASVLRLRSLTTITEEEEENDAEPSTGLGTITHQPDTLPTIVNADEPTQAFVETTAIEYSMPDPTLGATFLFFLSMQSNEAFQSLNDVFDASLLLLNRHLGRRGHDSLVLDQPRMRRPDAARHLAFHGDVKAEPYVSTNPLFLGKTRVLPNHGDDKAVATLVSALSPPTSLRHWTSLPRSMATRTFSSSAMTRIESSQPLASCV